MKLSGRTVLIAGGGKLARQKLATLEPTGANVVVAAPSIDLRGTDWRGFEWRGGGRLTLLTRAYGRELLEGCSLVFAATNDPAVNRRIVADAEERGILANAVDDPEFCDFYTPAVVRRAGATIAISTSGGFPGFSGALREILELWLPNGDDAALEDLFALRSALRHALDPEKRREALGELIEAVKRRYLEPTSREIAEEGRGDVNESGGFAGVGPSPEPMAAGPANP